jgi:hypothetical protein
MNHQCARRAPGSAWSRRAPTKTKSARCARSNISSRSTRPSRPTSFRAHNHETKRATGGRDTSSNAGRRARVLSFVPAGEAPWRAPGRVSSYRTPVSAALSLPSRATEAPPVRKRAALPDLLGYRTSFAREGQHPKVSATRKTVRCAADAANAAPWRNGGSLCRCSLRPVRRPTQLARWPPRRLGGQRHSAASNVSRPASGAQARACTRGG